MWTSGDSGRTFISTSNREMLSPKTSSWGGPYELAPKRRPQWQRDSRCKISTLDPDTAEPNPQMMKLLAREHEGKAGIYGAVLVEGTIRPGEQIALLD